jgi:hypothetical protein
MGRRAILLILVLAVGAAGIYLCWSRKADLRAFDPAEMARLETAMWRDYYEKHYPRLFYHLYGLSRTQFGFSPLDSFGSRCPPRRRQRHFSRLDRAQRPTRRCRNS